MRKIVLLLLIIFVSIAAQPQRVSHVFKNESLAKVLKILDKASCDYRIHFIYNELEDFVVTTSFRNKTIPNAVHDVVGFYPVRIVTDKESRNIFVECMLKGGRKLIGRLVDHYAQPVAYANVALLNMQDSSLITGGVSNESGDFVIPTHQKRVLMRVSCVGYETLYDVVDVKNIGTVRMRKKIMMVKTVRVKAHRPVLRMGKEGLVVHVPGTNLSYAGTAKDVLGLLPNITVENGNLSVFGLEGAPLVYINGKRVLCDDELSLLKADEINSIELITAPGAHHDAAASAVIKIKTVKKQGDGLGGTLEMGTSLAHDGSCNSSAGLNYRMEGLDVSGRFYYDNKRQFQRHFVSRNIQNFLSKHSSSIHDTHHTNLNGQLQLNYVFNDDHSTGFTYYVRRQHTVGHNSGRVHYVQSNGVAEDYRNHIDFDRINRPVHSFSTYYDGAFGKWNIDFNADYMYTGNSNERVAHVDRGGKRHTATSQNDNCSRLFAMKNVLSYSLWRGRLCAGYECTSTRRSSNSGSTGNITSVMDDEIRERTEALFVRYGAVWGLFSASVGMRYVSTHMLYCRSEAHNQSVHSSFHGWLPSAVIGFSAGDMTLRMSYVAEAKRPAYESLSGSQYDDDDYIYVKGNPFLHFSKLHMLSLEAKYRQFTFQSAYTDVHNEVVSLDRIEGGKTILYAPVNVPRRKVFRTLLIFAHRVGCWQPHYSVGVCKQQFDLSRLGIDTKLGRPYWLLKFRNTFTLPRGFRLDLTYLCMTSGDELAIRKRSRHNFSIFVCKSFLNDRLRVRLNANDVFRTYHDRNVYRGIHTIINRHDRSDMRSISLTLSYRFNATDSKYRGGGAGSDEKGRL